MICISERLKSKYIFNLFEYDGNDQEQVTAIEMNEYKTESEIDGYKNKVQGEMGKTNLSG